MTQPSEHFEDITKLLDETKRLTTEVITSEDEVSRQQKIIDKLVAALRNYPCCCSYKKTPSHLPREPLQCKRCGALQAVKDQP